jgi:hypothetical protein
MATSCKAGICFTPSFEAIQVLPQKKQHQQSANIGKPIAFFFLVI